MSISVKVRVRETKACPHCGQMIPGDALTIVESGGWAFDEEFRKGIGYTDEMYGKYMQLDKVQIGKLIDVLDGMDAGVVALALYKGYVVEFYCDW